MHFIEPGDFTIEQYDDVFRLADDIFFHSETYVDRLRGKILASLFFEPSTRTRISFEAAMLRLGGGVISIGDPKFSSLMKGETIDDTLRMVECYADVCAIRHPENFTPHKLAPILTNMNLINAGDGSNAHPTQTLTDLMTIRHTQGSLENLKIGFCGDLKYGRTVHSLLAFMKERQGNHFVLISPPEVRLPESYLEGIDPSRIEISNSLDASIHDLDVLYMTRIQKERFEDPEEAEKLRGSYHLNWDKLQKAKENMSVLHPLPRVDEIAKDVDKDPRALYFKQAKYGMYVRMALILYLLESR